MKLPIIIVAVTVAVPHSAQGTPMPPPSIPVSTLRVVNDKKEGLEVKLNDKGGLREVVSWNDGKRHGESRTYHPNGSLDTVCEWVSGMKHGMQRRYNRNGEIMEETHFANGEREGLYRRWLNDDRDKNNPQPMVEETQFADDLLHGEQRLYFDNGKLNRTGQHSLGKKQGEWRSYNQEGRVVLIQIFVDGTKVSESMP